MATLTTAQRKNLDDSTFGYVDDQGEGHFPLHDEAHVRNAIGRFPQANFPDADTKKQTARKIIAAAKKFGIEVADDANVKQALSAAEYLGLQDVLAAAELIFADHTHAKVGGGKVTHDHENADPGHSHDGLLPTPKGSNDSEPSDGDADDNTPAGMGEVKLGDAPGHEFRGNQYSGGGGGGGPDRSGDSAQSIAAHMDEMHGGRGSALVSGLRGKGSAETVRSFHNWLHSTGDTAQWRGATPHEHTRPDTSKVFQAKAAANALSNVYQAGLAEPANMAEATALYAVDTGEPVSLGEGKPIPFLTTGQWLFDEYGRFEVTSDDLHTIKRNFDDNVRRQELPIINEHHDPTRAVGWIKGLDFDGDNKLVAIPDWTPLGENLIQDGAYKYTSPEVTYKTLLLRNWHDPEHAEVKHPVIATGLAVTNFPKIKRLGAIAASESQHGCDLLAFAESDGQSPVSTTTTLLNLADQDNDGDDDGPPACVFQPSVTGSITSCPGWTRRADDADGDACCALADRGCNGYVAVSDSPVGNTTLVPLSALAEPLKSTKGDRTVTQTVSQEPEPEEPTAPEPEPTAPEPVTAVKASETAPDLHSLLMAERRSREEAQAKFEAAEERLRTAEGTLAAMQREKTVSGVRAEFNELLRNGQITPAQVKEILTDDDRAVFLAENRFIIDSFRNRPKNSAVPFGEKGVDATDSSADPMQQLTQLAAQLRENNPKLTDAAAFSEALSRHPDLYNEYRNEHNARARVMVES